MAKRDNSSAPVIPSGLGFDAHVFDEDDVVHLLRAAVEREGGQSAFAKRHGINRTYVNMILNGKRSVGKFVAKALRLRKVYIPK